MTCKKRRKWKKSYAIEKKLKRRHVKKRPRIKRDYVIGKFVNDAELRSMSVKKRRSWKKRKRGKKKQND